MSASTAAIVCTWNKREDLLECLASLTKVPEPFDLVVVDNASSDGTAEAVRTRFPEVTLLVNDQNLGGAGGFNTGLHYLLARPQYRHAWLLDNDVVVDPGALTGLQVELGRDRAVAIAGSLILRRDSPTTLQELGARVSLETFEREPLFKDHPLSSIGPAPVEVDYVPACSLLVDLDKVRKVGVMDEGYFLYYDDVEWCVRMKRAGYRVVATPASRVWHREGGRNRTSNLPVYYAWRNACHFFMEQVAGTPHVEPFLNGFLKRAFVAIALTKRLGKPNSCRTLVSALWDAILNRRGKAPESRIQPLDRSTVEIHLPRIGSRPVFLGSDLDFYTSLRPLIGEGGAEKLDFFTSVPGDRLPAWLLERVCLRPEREAIRIPDDSILVVLCPHLVTAPHPLEKEWARMLGRRGEQVCFYDQHSNAIWGLTPLRRLRRELDRDWQWFRDWIAPLIGERISKNVSGGR